MRLLNMGREKCRQAYAKYFRGATPEQIEYFYAFVSEGCIGLLRRWLREDMATDAAQIAAMAERFMAYGARSLEKKRD